MTSEIADEFERNMAEFEAEMEQFEAEMEQFEKDISEAERFLDEYKTGKPQTPEASRASGTQPAGAD